MFKSARYRPVLALLLVGLSLSVATLFIVANPLDSAVTPTPTEPVAPTPFPWPTQTPYPTPFLTENCESIGGDYQLQVINFNTVSAEELPSPNGEAVVYTEGNQVFLRRPNDTLQLWQENYTGGLFLFMFWSPNGAHLAYVMPDYKLYIIGAEAGEPVLIAALDNPHAFLGWSSDSQHVALQEKFLATISIWTADGERVYASEDDPNIFTDGYNVRWSPDGRWLTYIWRDNNRQTEGQVMPTGFTLVAADGSVSHKFQLSGEDDPIEPFRHTYTWSPTGDSFALSYLQSANDYIESVRVYTTQGQLIGQTAHQIVYPVYNELQLWSTDWSSIRWAADGRMLAYTLPVEIGRFDQMTFNLNTGDWLTVYPDMPKPVFYSPAGGYAAAYFGRGNPYAIAIRDIGTNAVSTLVENTTDAGDPDWSPDGAWVAATWATGENASRQVFVSWMHPDGTDRQDISGDYRHISDLRWLKGGRELAYIAWGSDEARIEIANLETGEQRTLASGLMAVRDFNYDAATDQLAFRWSNGQGFVNREAYQVSGEQVYSYRYPGDIERYAKEFWSPDGRVVALKTVDQNRDTEAVMLAFTDDRDAILVRTDLQGLGDPFWSPDSRAVAFSQWRGHPEQTSLQVVNTAGINLWEYPNFGVGWPVAWVKCE